MEGRISIRTLAALPAMRVALVTETYPPEINGVAMTMGRLVEGLKQRDHRVELVRPRQGDENYAAGEPHSEVVLVRGWPIPGYHALRAGLPAGRLLARRWLTRPPDVVHIATEGPLGWSALRVARRLRIPVSTDFHTNFHTYSRHYGLGALCPVIYRYLRRFHNRADCTMVPTEDIRTTLASAGFRKLKLVARGVDTRLFHPAQRSAELRRRWGVDENALAVISVGRIAPEKNLPLLFRAVDSMQAYEPAIRLIVVGDGPQRSQLQARYPRHIFAGTRVGSDLAAHYASGDIFLFPSLTETFGNVTVEAMASGLAVVAYDYAAAGQHIVHGRNGLLAPFGDADRFVREAAHLAGAPAQVSVLRVEALRTASRIDWESVFQHFEAQLQQLIHNPETHDELALISCRQDA
jgi:glycosyltransferase involved in cell wall biosynthesis